MSVRHRSGNDLSRSREGPGKLLVTRNGVYLVRGDSKLRNLELVSWEQLLRPALADARNSVLSRDR